MSSSNHGFTSSYEEDHVSNAQPRRNQKTVTWDSVLHRWNELKHYITRHTDTLASAFKTGTRKLLVSRKRFFVHGMTFITLFVILVFILRTTSQSKKSPDIDENAITKLDDKTFVPATYRILTSSYCLPKTSSPFLAHRLVDCGEDAVRVTISNDSTSCLIGNHHLNVILALADGVGGWSLKGIDSSIFSWSLVNCLATFFNSKDHKYNMRPKKLLTLCVEQLQESYQTNFRAGARKEGGSSTAIILKVNCIPSKHCDLLAANLGDSGFSLFQLSNDMTWECVLNSTEQQHAFNFPFQVAPMALFGDSPENADEYGISLQKNASYIAIVASDGLFDNLFVHEIQNMLNRHGDDITKEILDRLAQLLVERAVLVGANTTHYSPFCANARAHGYEYLGGYANYLS